MKGVQIQWGIETDFGFRYPEMRTYGSIGPVEVAMVMWEEYTPNGKTEPVGGWRTVVYLKPWPNQHDEWVATKEAAQEKAQKAVDALTELLTTGTASPDYKWL